MGIRLTIRQRMSVLEGWPQQRSAATADAAFRLSRVVRTLKLEPAVALFWPVWYLNHCVVQTCEVK